MSDDSVSSSSESAVRSVPKRAMLSSDEEKVVGDDGAELNSGGRGSPDSDQMHIGSVRRRRLYSSAAQLSTSDEEGGEEDNERRKNERLTSKHRRMKFKESDDEIE